MNSMPPLSNSPTSAVDFSLSQIAAYPTLSSRSAGAWIPASRLAFPTSPPPASTQPWEPQGPPDCFPLALLLHARAPPSQGGKWRAAPLAPHCRPALPARDTPGDKKGCREGWRRQEVLGTDCGKSTRPDF